MIAALPAEPVPIEITIDHGLWCFRSLDGRLSGAFIDRRAAVRAARDEAKGHEGYVVVGVDQP